MERLGNLNQQFEPTIVLKPNTVVKNSKKAVLDIWDSMDLDQHLSQRAIKMRQATAKVMEENKEKLFKHTEETTFPDWIIDELKPLGINGLSIRGYGSPGLTTAEVGAITYELTKVDLSVATFLIVHNSIGMAVIDTLGDDEQKERFLPKGIKFEKIFGFGLTEPLNGSDASALKTTATKVEGGYILNGQKRWIGNGTFGDICVWAKNEADGNRIQCFVVEKGTPGFNPKKIEGKMALRMTQNADIEIKDCFVPDKNKLTFAKDFATGTNKILEASRLVVAWGAAGIAAGCYEACLKYCLQRK